MNVVLGVNFILFYATNVYVGKLHVLNSKLTVKRSVYNLLYHLFC